MFSPKFLIRFILTFLLSALILAQAASVFAAPGDTTRVSVDSLGYETNDESYSPVISADGRYVAFESSASNLVIGDTNGVVDIFVRDTQSGTTTRISVDSSGNEANNYSSFPSISADGRYIAFYSFASNLVSGDTNGATDVFIRDTVLNTTARISVDSSGNEANNYSYLPSISADGRYVAFASIATNLVDSDTNNCRDIFVRDTLLNTTTRVSVDSSGNEANAPSMSPSISADGRYVAFESEATNLVNGDNNNATDIFIRDTMLNTTTRVSVDSSGNEANSYSKSPSISADGRYIAFYSSASNLVSGDTNNSYDIFVHDTVLNTTIRVSVDSSGNEANNHSYSLAISADGHFVAFESDASNLVSGDTNGGTDIFVRDISELNSITLVSVDSSSNQGNDQSYYPSISADGRFVAFQSSASNLVSGDTNWFDDIFVHERTDLPPAVLSITRADSNPTNASNVCFSVIFSEPVSGVDKNDFSLTTIGEINGASVTAASGSGMVYKVTIDTGSGNGTLRLDLNDDDSITDTSSNSLGGTGSNNGSFNNGESYTVNKEHKLFLPLIVR